ncbi:MAG TPA: hypothetical protein VNG31_01695 [Candidatus Baltobacteraceae bacterium]|nr:hypothetical protein [Candidatus Baltobacteraceae bacterium]
MKRFLIALVAASLVVAPASTIAAGSKSPAQQLMSKLHWRSIGPFIGGRVVAVAGVPSIPNLFYMGGVEGGVWKSTDYGSSWTNITDGKIPGIANPIGALAVAPSNPNVIYAGTGEADIRSDFDSGDGIYKSTNAGKTWSYAGLRDTHMTSKLVIDPHDPNVVYAASMGHVFKPNADRGIFKTTNGGKSWHKILFVDDKTGGVDLAMDQRHPATLYAAMWQAQRLPWKLTSGGPGSGLYKTTDGGAHWAKISNNPGYARGTLGKIGVSVAQSDPRVVYSIVQAANGGVFRSDNGGKTWKHTNNQWKLRQRAFYYTAIFADPTNPKKAYAPNVNSMYVTTDGGTVWKTIDNIPHGDHHIIWINPNHPNILVEGNDGGATVSANGGQTWSTVWNQPTGQIYHVALDNQFPFHIFGASQDEGAWEYVSAANGGAILFNSWHPAAAGESTFVAPDPDDPAVTYGAGYYSSMLQINRVTGQTNNVSPWPLYMAGASSAETKYRFGWTHPIFFSPADPHELLVAAQVVFSSTDRGETWKIISPDLTRNEPSTEGPTGGPIFLDQTGAETFPDIASLAVSPLDKDVLWAGSADGLVHVTKDHGVSWTAVTPPQLPQWCQISSIEPSHTDKGTAYLTASRYMWDDYHPYVYETTDYGAHWTQITSGLPSDQYVFVVRQDPREPRLLFAGTRSTVYVSLDAGAHWQPLTLDLPGVQVRDLAISTREGELVAATHGRAYWILDNLALLEQLARQTSYTVANAQLFAPETAWLTQTYGSSFFTLPDAGENPKYGARVFFNLPANYNGHTPLTLSFVDAKGATIRTFGLHLAPKKHVELTEDQLDRMDALHMRAHDLDEATAVKPGMNAFQWDMKYSPAYDPPGYANDVTDDFPDVGDGPTTLPGSYSVVLQYGSQRLTAPLTIQLDPRVHPAAGDLEARLGLEQQILGTIDRLDRSIAAAMNARSRLPAARRAQLDGAIADLVLLGSAKSSEYDVVYPSKLREQLGFLMNSLEGAYRKPTPADYTTYDDLKAQAASGEARLTQLTTP